jgi:hypothetical protein
MPKRVIDTGFAKPLLDVASYARRGPGHRDHLSPEEIQLIARTVRRSPEVMVKVLSRGGQDMKAVGKHFAYLSRKGDLAIETDQGQELRGKQVEADLLKDWDLDIQGERPTSALGAKADRKAPKLVHKLMFSMPPGTPSKKVLTAVKVFAREEFGLKHRYAMVLHTDEPHPHVHVVVKAVSEEGVRLNIRKATLRDWRRAFARRLREQGVEANATERAVRGKVATSKSDGIYRAHERGASTHTQNRAYAVASELHKGNLCVEPTRSKLRETRGAVDEGWRIVSRALIAEGHQELGGEVRRFAQAMPPPTTEREQIAVSIMERHHGPPQLHHSVTR